MEIWPNDDHETPIEYYPGYLGHTYDRDIWFGPRLSIFSEFDWWGYLGLVDDVVCGSGEKHKLIVELRSGPIEINFDASYGPVMIIDHLPCINGYIVNDPPGARPSGSGHVLILADDTNGQELEKCTAALAKALNDDLVKLE